MASYKELRVRTAAEKEVLLKMLDLTGDPTNATRKAELALALEALDHERSADVSHAIAKALARPTSDRYRRKLI